MLKLKIMRKIEKRKEKDGWRKKERNEGIKGYYQKR